MQLTRELLEQLIFGHDLKRQTQDSPILPDVWIAYGVEKPERRDGTRDVLLEPKRRTSPAVLAQEVRAVGAGDVAYHESHVVARVTLEQLARHLLPMSSWWWTHVARGKAGDSMRALLEGPPGRLAEILERPVEKTVETKAKARDALTPDALWLLRILGVLAWAQRRTGRARMPSAKEYTPWLQKLLRGVPWVRDEKRPVLWSITRNRPAATSVWQSSSTVKADAAKRVFNIQCSGICWAVLDTGIDARHAAFRKRNAQGALLPLGAPDWSRQSRVRATYDFTQVRELFHADSALARRVAARSEEHGVAFQKRLRLGEAIDWGSLLQAGAFTVPHDAAYRVPANPHGTHVAGIIGGNWRRTDPGYAGDEDGEYDLEGLCPDIELIDVRVLDDRGFGDEFSIIAALQFIRYANEHSIHRVDGANVSIAINHDVSNYACGRTPVCDEAERLVASGVVVVAAAGNRGYVKYLTAQGEADAYRNISITDPGNADSVITVGAVHRSRPHSYGVSYFSSRGPTGDGRAKPDVVAPGEKIKSAAPDERALSLDGTSQAAPHVSGAAALLLARHRELLGDPARVKEILCRTATDIGRERYFQGHGLVDALRALQSV